MMGDRRALQAGTSHNLGDNFAKVGKSQRGIRTGVLLKPGLSARMLNL